MPVPIFMRSANVSRLVIDTRSSVLSDLSIPIIVDFEQPRILYTKVMSDTDREHLIQNIAGNIRNVRSAEIKARQRRFLSLFHQNLSYLMTLQSQCSLP